MKNIFSSILSMNCPSCREGKLFHQEELENRGLFKMPKYCNVCKQNFEPEPGFYFGAMFISYILWAFVAMLIVIPAIWLLKIDVDSALMILVGITVVCYVWLFRISRSIYIHLALSVSPMVKSDKTK